MLQEYEVIHHAEDQPVKVFLVDLRYRGPHIHDALELGLVLSGRLHVRTTQEEHWLKEGDAYVISEKQLHAFSADHGSAVVLVFQLTGADEFRLFDGRSGWRFSSLLVETGFQKDPEAYKLFWQLCIQSGICAMQKEKGARQAGDALIRCAAELMKSWLTLCPIPKGEQTLLERQDLRISRITEFIEDNFRSKVLLSQIAKQEHISMNYLSRYFKETLQISFQDYVSQCRLSYACQLLAGTEKSVTEISSLSGFSDPRYLIKICQSTFGCTPQEYRLRKRDMAGEQRGEERYDLQSVFQREESIQYLKKYQTDNHADLEKWTLGQLVKKLSGPCEDKTMEQAP